MGIPYYEKDNQTFTCRNCSWTGAGSELEPGEFYWDVAEWACPKCGEKVGSGLFPSREETQAAADAGNQKAINHLPMFDERERWWRRVLETRGSDVVAPAELDHGDVRCVLDLVNAQGEHWLTRAQGEPWLTLTANGREIHRELATWESIEPARRLLALLRERYGGRLRSFDYNPAFLYLCGDRLSAIGELRRLVVDLPEGDSTSSADERRAD